MHLLVIMRSVCAWYRTLNFFFFLFLLMHKPWHIKKFKNNRNSKIFSIICEASWSINEVNPSHIRNYHTLHELIIRFINFNVCVCAYVHSIKPWGKMLFLLVMFSTHLGGKFTRLTSCETNSNINQPLKSTVVHIFESTGSCDDLCPPSNWYLFNNN